MVIETKLFGEVDVDDNKKITFTQGIIGFPDLKDFLLVHDSESSGGIRWMQSVQEPAFALPVIDPLIVMPDYNPQVEDELLKPLGEISEENTLVLVTITVPHDLTKMTVNLKAPIVINGETRLANQIITDDEKYLVKYPIYDILQAAKERAGE